MNLLVVDGKSNGGDRKIGIGQMKQIAKELGGKVLVSETGKTIRTKEAFFHLRVEFKTKLNQEQFNKCVSLIGPSWSDGDVTWEYMEDDKMVFKA